MQVAENIQLPHQIDPRRKYQQVYVPAQRRIIDPGAEKKNVGLRIPGANGSQDGLSLTIVQSHDQVEALCASAAVT
jgi:hypothetical protein